MPRKGNTYLFTSGIHRFVVSASQLKEQTAGRYAASFGHFILIPSQPVFALYSYCCALIVEAIKTNFIVFGLTRLGIDPMIYRNCGEHDNHLSQM